MRLSKYADINTGMAKRQGGMSFISLIVIFSVVGLIFLLGLKIIPAYLDYFTVKKIIANMKTSDEVKTGTVADIRKSFDKRVSADYSEVVKSEDLEITKDGNDTVVTAAWTHRIPIIARHTLLIEFSTSTADK
jgi:Domain of unknown function (DUF4845)